MNTCLIDSVIVELDVASLVMIKGGRDGADAFERLAFVLPLYFNKNLINNIRTM